MPAISRDQVVTALAETLREALAQGDDVHVPGLGTFAIERRPSEAVEQPDGQVTMKPPRNEIVFTADDDA